MYCNIKYDISKVIITVLLCYSFTQAFFNSIDKAAVIILPHKTQNGHHTMTTVLTTNTFINVTPKVTKALNNST